MTHGQESSTSRIKSRLVWSYATIGAIGVLLLLLCVTTITLLSWRVTRLTEIRMPISVLASGIQNGLQSSHSELQQWIILGQQEAKTSRRRTWEGLIIPSFDTLAELCDASGGDADFERLSELKPLLRELQLWQWRIEDIAQQPGNTPPRLIYDLEIRAMQTRIEVAMASLAASIHVDERRTPWDRSVSDLRFSLQNVVIALERLTLDPTATNRSAFIVTREEASQQIEKLHVRASELPKGQTEVLEWIRQDFRALEILTSDIIANCEQGNINIAETWLRRQVQPLMYRTNALLGDVAASQQALAAQALANTQFAIRFSIVGSVALTIAMAASAFYLARRHSMAVMRDITREKQYAAEKEELTRQMVEMSRQAGMAEFAAGVLHNVGNGLNSVNTSATLLQQELSNGKHLSNLRKAAEVLGEHADALPEFFTNDRKGQLFPEVLSRLASCLTSQRNRSKVEVECLVEGISHVKRIVSDQQSYASARGVTESVQVSKLVDDAIKISGVGLSNIELIRDDAAWPTVDTDRHKVLQILTNLLSNAKHAIHGSRSSDSWIRIESSVEAETLSIAVTDSGIGITQDNLEKIFTHGFTTRKEGHGFGLHHSVLSAQDLGGNLVADSDGPGCGATFTLTLPISADSNASLALATAASGTVG